MPEGESAFQGKTVFCPGHFIRGNNPGFSLQDHILERRVELHVRDRGVAPIHDDHSMRCGSNVHVAIEKGIQPRNFELISIF
jgi:hypothetical protein